MSNDARQVARAVRVLQGCRIAVGATAGFALIAGFETARAARSLDVAYGGLIAVAGFLVPFVALLLSIVPPGRNSDAVLRFEDGRSGAAEDADRAVAHLRRLVIALGCAGVLAVVASWLWLEPVVQAVAAAAPDWSFTAIAISSSKALGLGLVAFLAVRALSTVLGRLTGPRVDRYVRSRRERTLESMRRRGLIEGEEAV